MEEEWKGGKKKEKVGELSKVWRGEYMVRKVGEKIWGVRKDYEWMGEIGKESLVEEVVGGERNERSGCRTSDEGIEKGEGEKV